MTDRKTLEVYDAQAEDYSRLIANWQDSGLDAFIATLPASGAVLDLGCGPGNAAAKMAAAGLNVTATDGSAEMVRLAARHPGVTALQATFDEITGDALYDGILASFSLLHAPRSALPRHLAALHRAAKPGAILLLRMKLGQGEAVDSLGRFYSYFSESELNGLLEQAGFSVASARTGRDKGLAGDIEDWIAITAHA